MTYNNSFDCIDNCHVTVIFQNNKVAVVDYLKGFSILAIVLLHLIEIIPNSPNLLLQLIRFGGSGVHIFFFCSGLGLYISYLKNKFSFIKFLKRRFYKLYIPYVIVVLMSSLLPWMYLDEDRLIAFFSHVFLFKMFVPRYEQSFGVQFWFISTIFQLCLLFFPMCKIKEKIKNNTIFLCLFISISFIWSWFCYVFDLSDVRIWSSFCFQYIWEFALGFVIAEGLFKGKIFKFNILWLLMTAVIGFGIQALLSYLGFSIFNDFAAFFGFISFSLLLYNFKIFRKLIHMLSCISYELYLIHILVFITVFYFFKSEGVFFSFFLCVFAFSLAVILSFLFNRFIQVFEYDKSVK